ncbi:ester cyclase [Christiangramia sediminis]|uniref:Ester cyclase n=1 Tax=Christiangramia sediminis TaxID=2881336 RepID=A0A9X1LL20_9FLAO|nr:ester cyclase [Christiangramia sediminis]MCB7482127.1 ester cyclase [Christiangramia sediminis]
MKKSAILLALILFGISLSFAQNQTEKNIETYSRVWDEILNNGEIDQINNSSFDENVVIINSPENIKGIENFKNYYQNFLTGFSDINFDIINIFGQDDNIVKHWRFKGTHSGDFFGIPATGKNLDLEGVTLVKMKNGKILEEHDFMDNMEFMGQLGLISDAQNMKLIDSVYSAFSSGNVPGVLSQMDPEIQWNEAEGNKYAEDNPYVGPDAVMNGVFGRIMTEHEYFKLKDIELHEMSNNQILATLRYDAKWKNGQAYDAQAAHLWTLKDGKIVAFQQYVDTKKLAESEND